jgi:hypothetical protein
MTRRLIKVVEINGQKARVYHAKHLANVTLANHTAKVYYAYHSGEYQVEFYKDGKYMGEDPTLYTDDKHDAIVTAQAEVARMNAKHYTA